MNTETVGWMLVLLGLAAFVGLSYWLIRMASRGQLMRCPETGAVSIVQVAPTADDKRKGSALRVTQCDLWPQKKGCAQGCLARHAETGPGFHVNLDALRPFDSR
jgi:hypothetical protein